MRLNEFDLLIIVFLFIGIVYGAIRGAARQLVGLLSAWLGLIICLWLYIPFSRRILKGLFVKQENAQTASNVVFDTFSFVILLILFAVIVQFLFFQTTKSPEEKMDTSGTHFTEKANRKSPVSVLNVLGGLFTGFIVTTVWLSIFMAPVQHAVFAINSRSNLVNSLKAAMTSSALLPFFKQVLNGIYLSIQHFIPPTGGLPVIFSTFLNG